MKKAIGGILLLGALTACTHGVVATTAMEVPGVGTVYRYQGRANFAHQIAEADKMMAEHCAKVNGGRPIIVDLEKRDLGTVAVGSSNSTTRFNATATSDSARNQARISGTANTQTLSSASMMRNMNQEITYRCAAN